MQTFKVTFFPRTIVSPLPERAYIGVVSMSESPYTIEYSLNIAIQNKKRENIYRNAYERVYRFYMNLIKANLETNKINERSKPAKVCHPN